MSEPCSAIALAVSSGVSTDWLPATGGSFSGVTAMETVAVLESRVPSFTVKTNESGPL